MSSTPLQGAPGKTAVLLLAHGTPDRVEEIPEFLRNVTGGRPVPQPVIDEVKHRYTLIGRSPLRELTMKQAELTARELGLPVYVGMRNWTPYIPDVAAKMAADGVQRAVAICLAPQNSRTSVGLYKRALSGESGQAPFAVEFIESWHDQPYLISAFTEKLNAGWRSVCAEVGAKIPVIFTAHSVPTRTIVEGDPYEEQARQTAELVAIQCGALSLDDWRFAFQSQGMSGGPWLGPTVEETIRELKQQGHKGVFIQPIGFLCDHVEVLYDIDIAFKKFAEELGMRQWRAESLNDSPLLAKALAEVARAALRPVVAGENKPSALVQIAEPE
ncbi:MAG: ferrochelatase [Terriglobales bacterium]